MEKRRMVIYQLLPRLFGNKQSSNIKGGTLAQNGSGKFSAIDEAALAAIADLGATHIWYTGVLEHATCTDYSAYGIVRDSRDVVKGEAGSPYAIKDYYDVDPDLADVVDRRMKEFEALVERTHKQGLKVLIDLVPNHLARQYVSDAAPEGVVDFGAGDRRDLAFHKDNNFYYLPGARFDSPEAEERGERWEEEPARATGNDCFKANPGHGDWYETVKLNYGVDFVGDSPEDFDPEPDTWLKMRDVVLYWADKGIDGFRCDMAGMVPIAFWRWMIGEVRRRYPKLLFIAEVYEQERYHDFIFKAGFDYLYDKVVLYDTLRAVLEGKAAASALTAAWQQTDGLHGFLLYFLENHDEQRLASDFFLGDGARALPGMVVTATMFNNPLLLYFGQELGEPGMDEEGFSGVDGRTSIFDYWHPQTLQLWQQGHWGEEGLSEASRRLRAAYKRLMKVLQEHPAFVKGRFYDLMWANKDNPAFDAAALFAFLRYHEGRQYLVVANFSEQEQSFKLRIPSDAMQVCGMKAAWFYAGKDLLGGARKLQFPAQIALNGGLGARMAARSAAVYELSGSAVE